MDSFPVLIERRQVRSVEGKRMDRMRQGRNSVGLGFLYWRVAISPALVALLFQQRMLSVRFILLTPFGERGVIMLFLIGYHEIFGFL